MMETAPTLQLALAAVALILLAAVLVRLARRPKPAFAPPTVRPVSDRALAAFEARPSLFVNRSEAALWAVLRQHCPARLHVLAKVRLEDIIGVRAGVRGEARWKLRGRVKSRHVDFLVIDGAGTPLAAIELDGSAHKPGDVADGVKDALFAAVGLALHRVRVGEDFHAFAWALFAGLGQALPASSQPALGSC